MSSPNSRPGVALLLPAGEREPVAAELRAGGFEPIDVAGVEELGALLGSRRDIAVALIDVETDLDAGLDAWSLIHDSGRKIPALLVVAGATLERLATAAVGHDEDEYLTRPYSAESIRWRVEAMCIRSVAVDDGSGPVLQSSIDPSEWTKRGHLIAVFNPKGGVGKTTIATNLAASIARRGLRALLIDADTVTGHVTQSLGMDAVPTVVDAWRDELEGGPVMSFDELAATHSSGLQVIALAASPIHTEILEPQRVAGAITVARRGVDFVVVDLHPSYSPLNRAIFDRADRILVPVTPDLPAIRAAVQLRDVAEELGVHERLALIVNRANSGVSVEDLERTIGMPAFALIRSGGMVLVRAANEGRTVVEMAPGEKIAQDFDELASRVLGEPEAEPVLSKVPFRLFGRPVALRA